MLKASRAAHSIKFILFCNPNCAPRGRIGASQLEYVASGSRNSQRDFQFTSCKVDESERLRNLGHGFQGELGCKKSRTRKKCVRRMREEGVFERRERRRTRCSQKTLAPSSASDKDAVPSP